MKCKANCSNAGTNLHQGDWLLHRNCSIYLCSIYPLIQSIFEQRIACSFKNIYLLSAVVAWL